MAISRAHGGLVASLDGDEQNLDACARAFAAAVKRANERYRAIALLEAENRALVDRFGVSGAKLPRVVAPSQREACIAASRMLRSVGFADDYTPRPSTEECPHRLRERRDYKEVEGTPAHAIIAMVGPKPWRQMTERERRAVEAASGEVTVGSMVASEAAVIAALPPGVSAFGAEVRRG